MGETSLLQTLKATRGAIDVYNDNLVKAKTPNARAIDPVIKSGNLGTALFTSLEQIRRDDPFVSKLQISQLTKAIGDETICDFLQEIQNEITGQDPQQSLLVTSIANFLYESTVLVGDNDASVRQVFIDKGQDLTINLNKITSKITELRYTADQKLYLEIDRANTAIRDLLDINQSLIKGGSNNSKAYQLFDQRDDLVRTIAEVFDIKVNYGSKGEALLSSRGGSLPIVASNSYSQLSYEGYLSKEDIMSGKDPKPINITYLSDKAIVITAQEAITSSGPNANTVGGGKIGALISLRDKQLKDAYLAVQNLVKGVTNEFNKIHNDGSTWPPKTKFQSDIKVYGTDVLEWGGKVNIHPVNANGDQLLGAGGPLNAITIDFDKLPNGSGGLGSPTVWDVIRELNSQLDDKQYCPRVAMGEIIADNPKLTGFPQKVPGQYLLNNIQLSGMSNIDNLGEFTFDLDLTGNQYFGSEVEVLNVTTSGGYTVPVNQLPKSFRLDKGTNSRTNNAITVSGLVGASQTISVKIRVMGDNGEVKEGTAEFVVDPASPALINKRISSNAAASLTTAGGFVDAAISHSGIATVKMIDDNGVEIIEGSSTQGRLIIETNSDDYRLVIQDGNFSNLMKFNDLIQHDEATGLIKIREDIINDANLLSTGKVTRSEYQKLGTVVGDKSATASLTFSAGNFAAGDAVTIHDQTFTFVVGVTANQNEITVTGVQMADVNALLTAIQNHTGLKGIITASSPAAASINFIANNAGTSGNIIGIVTNLVGGALASIKSGVGLASVPNANAGGLLDGGTDKQDPLIQQIYTYSMGNRSAEVLSTFNGLTNKLINFAGSGIVPDAHMTLGGYASQITSILSNQVNDAESNSEVSKIVLSKTQERIKEEFGIIREEQYLKTLEYAQYAKDIASAMKERMNSIRSIHDILFGS